MNEVEPILVIFEDRKEKEQVVMMMMHIWCWFSCLLTSFINLGFSFWGENYTFPILLNFTEISQPSWLGDKKTKFSCVALKLKKD